MTSASPRLLLTCAFLLAISGPARAGEAPAGEAPKAEIPKAEAAPPVHEVTRRPISIEVTVDGVFGAKQAEEIALFPEVWSDLSVLDAVDHGTHVKKGDTLVRLDTKKIDEALVDSETGLELSAMALEQAVISFRILEQSVPMDLVAAERTKTRTDEDLLRFLKIDRPFSEESADFSLKSSKNYLEYEKEELRQLEKMYKADDLTEETEEIVLKRQRDAVERSEFSVRRAELSHEESLKISIPRQEADLKDGARRQMFAWKKAEIVLPLSLKKARVELEKAKRDHARAEERHQKLRADRALLELESPIDGIVYYGKCTRGVWSDPTPIVAKLRKGGSLQSGDVFLTVVKPTPIVVHSVISEGELYKVKKGLKGTAVPTGYPEAELAVSLESVSAVPVGMGKFPAVLRVQPSDCQVVPGMSCKVRLVAYEKPNAIVVPEKAIFQEKSDKSDQAVSYVYRIGKDGSPKKCTVTVGKKIDGQLEIVKGLKEGDKVLLEEPKADS